MSGAPAADDETWDVVNQLSISWQQPNQANASACVYGFLYGVNIIDTWTQSTADGANIFWNASTWKPSSVPFSP